MFKVLVTGCNGQLGSELRRLASGYPGMLFSWTDVDELDISSFEAVRSYLQTHPQHLLINCAAYTAVDKAESDPAGAYRVNSDAVKNLAQAAGELDLWLIHLSTDFVFDGMKNSPYKENDPVNPLSVYGKSKLEGEQFALASGIVVRTSWLYSSVGVNFLKTILRLGKEREELKIVFDQVGTPTYARDLATALLALVETCIQKKSFPKEEIYHFSNEGVCSWYDFAYEIIKSSALPCKVKPIETREYPSPAKRPPYSVLDKAKIKAFTGISIPHWRDSLLECLKEID